MNLLKIGVNKNTYNMNNAHDITRAWKLYAEHLRGHPLNNTIIYEIWYN